MAYTSHSGLVLTGDWRKANMYINQLGYVADEINQIIREYAYAVLEAVKANIPYEEVPNAPSTISHKGSDSPLVESGNFRDFGIIVDESSESGAGIKRYYTIKGSDEEVLEFRGGETRDQGITYEQLFEILINGTNDGVIPARDILKIQTKFDIALEQFRGEFDGIIIQKAEDMVRRRLQSCLS